jgi:hypothetical protein
MKKLALVICMMGMATFGFSQGQGQPRQGQGQERQGPPSQKEMLKRATADLQLSDEQVKEWEMIMEKYSSVDRDRKKADETRKEMNDALLKTLTEDQAEKFKKMQEKQGPPRKD